MQLQTAGKQDDEEQVMLEVAIFHKMVISRGYLDRELKCGSGKKILKNVIRHREIDLIGVISSNSFSSCFRLE